MYYLQCDEARPGCRNCSNYGVACSYPVNLDAGNRMRTVGPLGDPSMVMFSMSLDNMTTKIGETLSFYPGSGIRMPRMSGSDRPLEVQALRHFVNCTVETISTVSIRELMRTDAVQVAFAVSYTPSFIYRYTTILPTLRLCIIDTPYVRTRMLCILSLV